MTMHSITVTVRRSEAFGFPFVEDSRVPTGELWLVLETSPANSTGRAELHGRAFVATEGLEVGIFLEGFVDFPLTAVRFTAEAEGIPDIGTAFQEFLDDELPVY